MEYLENIYEIDFNELEEQRYQKKLEKKSILQSIMESGESIELAQGKYVVGVEIPEGKYILVNEDDGYMMATVYYKNGNEKKDIFTRNKEVTIKIKDGETLSVSSPIKMKK